MARLRSELKRAALEVLWETSPPASQVWDALNAFRIQCFTAIKGGRVVTQVSGNGYSSGYAAVSAMLETNQVEVLAEAQELIDIYRLTLTNNPTVADGPGSAGDALVNLMLQDDRLAGAREEMNDYTGLRFGYGTNFAV